MTPMIFHIEDLGEEGKQNEGKERNESLGEHPDNSSTEGNG